MKILYFLAHPKSIGGAMKVLLTQAHIMQMHDNQVKVVIQNDDSDTHIPEYEELCEKYGLEYDAAKYPIATCMENIDILACMNSYKVVKNIVDAYKPDLIHSVQINTIVEYVARELDIPHLMNIYQISEGMFNIKWLNVLPRYQSGDSYFYCNQWKQGLGIESECIRVAYDNKNKYISRKYKNANDKIEFINIALVTEHKRQFEIIKFIEKCKNNGYIVHINFLGNNKNDYAEKCEEYVRNHNLDEEVTFTGQVLGVESYLRQADLMIHASTCESYPGVIVEAMANRVPVLVTPVAGIPELVKNEENGFLTKGYTYYDLYEAFENYVACVETEKIGEIVDNAYDTYRRNHTYNVIYVALNNYYQRLLSVDIMRNNDFSEMKNNIEKIVGFGKKIEIEYCSLETQKNLWLIYHIKQIIDENKYCKAMIWGAGHFGKIAIEWCELLALNVVEILDSFKEGEFKGYSIKKPTVEVITEADILFLAMANIEACEKNIILIENAGKIRNKDYFLVSNNPCIQRL